MTAANCPFGKWRTIFQLGRLIKSNNKIENRKITFSYKTISFQPKKLEKDQFFIKFKFSRNFKLLSCLLLFLLKHLSNNLFWWRHVFINSDFLFSNWLSLVHLLWTPFLLNIIYKVNFCVREHLCYYFPCNCGSYICIF